MHTRARMQASPLPKLHVIGNRFFLTEFLLQTVQDDPDIVVHFHPKKQRGAHRSLLKLWEAYVFSSRDRSMFFPLDYVSELRQIGSHDSVLIFGVENIKELRIVKKLISSKNISIFTWNPVVDHNQNRWLRSLHIKSLKKIGTVFTFDPLNARDHHLTLVDQVYRDVSAFLPADDSKNVVQDIYFVGQDKGRLDQLGRWKKYFQSMGLRTLFLIVGDRKKHYSSAEKELLSAQGIGYQDNIKNIINSNCLFEIVQPNQSGLTVRSMEAFFFGKKLITNNQWICQTALYSSDSVFILGKDNLDDLPHFIAKPMSRLSPAELSKYEFKNWCQQFR